MPKVLHVTAHMGGGVGKVLSGIACHAKQINDEYEHEILLLEEPQNTQFVDKCKQCSVPIYTKNEINIEEKLKTADIVQIEWWHHPETARFIHQLPEIPLHLIVWSHVSGCNYPYLPIEFVKIPKRFMFTSPYSLDNPMWCKDELKKIDDHYDVVPSSGGFNDVVLRKDIPHNSFNVGYIGTLDFIKMHPQIIDYCVDIDIPNAKFIFVGDAENRVELEEKAKEKGISQRLEFVGYTKNIENELARFDVFGYLLNPQHYGTAENALLEAMAAGIPVIVLNQCSEKYTVKHMETGLVVNNKKEYKNALKYLYENPDERTRIGRNAREFALRELSIVHTVDKLNRNYKLVLQEEKEVYNFDNVFGREPYEWFLSCLNEDVKYFHESMNEEIMTDQDKINLIEFNIANSRRILRGKNKSSVFQFQRYFPHDKWLSYWADVMSKYDYTKDI